MSFKNEKLSNVLLWILIVFSGFYINLIPVRPVYITMIIGILGYFFIEMKSIKDIKLDSLSIFTLIWVVYMSISFIFIRGDIGTTFNSIISVFMYFIGIQYLSRKNEKFILKTSKDFINISIILLITECIIRMMNPRLDKTSIYRYKFNSIMYEDSNYVGIFIICLFFYTIYLSRYKKEDYTKQRIILFVLCCLTMSRAAILSTLVTLIGIKILDIFNKITEKYTKKQKTQMICIISIIFIVIGILGISILLKDGSFRSKFYIIEHAIKHLKDSSLTQFLFGVGFGKTYDYIGIGAHNILVAYILESGLIGLILFMIFNIMIAIQTKGKALIVMIPFLTAGMSLAGFTLPFLYIIYSMIYTLENEKGRLM